MNRSLHEKNRLGIYLPLFILGVISSVTLRTVAFFRDLNTQTGYFREKTLITIAGVVAAGVCFILLLHALTHTRKDSVPKIRFDNATTYVPLGGLATSVLLLSFNIFGVIAKSIKEGRATNSVQLAVMIICCVLGVLSVGTFVMDLLIEQVESQLRGAFTLITVMFFALYAANVYFSDSMAENSQQKILTELGFIFTAAFFLYEARVSLGTQKWHAHAAFALAAALLLFNASVPGLILLFAQGADAVQNNVYELAAMLAMAIFITARAMLIAFCPEDELCELAEAIEDMEYEREKVKNFKISDATDEENVALESDDYAREDNIMVESDDKKAESMDSSVSDENE